MLSNEKFIGAFESIYLFIYLWVYFSPAQKHSGIKYIWRISVKHLWLSLYMQCFIPRGVLQISSDGDGQIGTKTKTQKNP